MRASSFPCTLSYSQQKSKVILNFWASSWISENSNRYLFLSFYKNKPGPGINGWKTVNVVKNKQKSNIIGLKFLQDFLVSYTSALVCGNWSSNDAPTWRHFECSSKKRTWITAGSLSEWGRMGCLLKAQVGMGEYIYWTPQIQFPNFFHKNSSTKNWSGWGQMTWMIHFRC